jgi:hypothetical protein
VASRLVAWRVQRHAAGVDIAGLLPGDLNEVTAFGAGITAGCKDVDAATALLKFLG